MPDIIARKARLTFAFFCQIVDLEDASLKPPGWDDETPRENSNYRHPADMSVYELHIRDFSMFDPKVPAELRGKYAAFGADGLGAAHLRDLQVRI